MNQKQVWLYVVIPLIVAGLGVLGYVAFHKPPKPSAAQKQDARQQQAQQQQQFMLETLRARRDLAMISEDEVVRLERLEAREAQMEQAQKQAQAAAQARKERRASLEKQAAELRQKQKTAPLSEPEKKRLAQTEDNIKQMDERDAKLREEAKQRAR